MTRRRVLLGLGGTGAAAGLLAMGVDRLTRSQSVLRSRVQIATVTRGDLVRDILVSGRMVAASNRTLFSPANGKVSFKVRAGETLSKGQVVATIESLELEAELNQAQAEVAELEAALGQSQMEADEQKLNVQREKDEADIAYRSAQRELEKIAWGYKQGVVSEIEYHRAQDTSASAKLRVQNAQARLRLSRENRQYANKVIQSQLDRKRLVVEDLLRQIDELQIRSTIDGSVGNIIVDDQTQVTKNERLLTLVDLSQLAAELQVPEAYADDLQQNMSVEIESGGLEVHGKITAISPEVVERKVETRVQFESSPKGFRQSQRVSARILIASKADVLKVSRGQFVEENGGAYIYIVRANGVAERKEIELGVTNSSEVEIREGLSEGDHVVISGANSFNEAERVQLIDDRKSDG